MISETEKKTEGPHYPPIHGNSRIVKYHSTFLGIFKPGDSQEDQEQSTVIFVSLKNSTS